MVSPSSSDNAMASFPPRHSPSMTRRVETGGAESHLPVGRILSPPIQLAANEGYGRNQDAGNADGGRISPSSILSKKLEMACLGLGLGDETIKRYWESWAEMPDGIGGGDCATPTPESYRSGGSSMTSSFDSDPFSTLSSSLQSSPYASTPPAFEGEEGVPGVEGKGGVQLASGSMAGCVQDGGEGGERGGVVGQNFADHDSEVDELEAEGRILIHPEHLGINLDEFDQDPSSSEDNLKSLLHPDHLAQIDLPPREHESAEMGDVRMSLFGSYQLGKTSSSSSLSFDGANEGESGYEGPGQHQVNTEPAVPAEDDPLWTPPMITETTVIPPSLPAVQVGVPMQSSRKPISVGANIDSVAMGNRPFWPRPNPVFHGLGSGGTNMIRCVSTPVKSWKEVEETRLEMEFAAKGEGLVILNPRVVGVRNSTMVRRSSAGGKSRSSTIGSNALGRRPSQPTNLPSSPTLAHSQQQRSNLGVGQSSPYGAVPYPYSLLGPDASSTLPASIPAGWKPTSPQSSPNRTPRNSPPSSGSTISRGVTNPAELYTSGSDHKPSFLVGGKPRMAARPGMSRAMTFDVATLATGSATLRGSPERKVEMTGGMGRETKR